MAVQTGQTRASRPNAIVNALSSGWIEGPEPSAGAMAIFRIYADGELMPRQVGGAID